jgi:enoyl-CoA hydratase
MSEQLPADDILIDRSVAGIAAVSLNRPSQLNALTREMLARFNTALDELAADEDCRAVIIMGSGRAFCAGLDLQAANSRNKQQSSGAVDKLVWQEHFAGLGARLRAMPKLVVAAVNGPAAGVGMALALSADVRIATPSARFLIASVRLGLSAGESGISYLLPRMIGASRAFDILLTGRPIEAAEAERIGLVLRLAEPGDLLAQAIGYAQTVLANSPYSVAQTKKLMWDNLDASFAIAIAAENRTQILGTMTRDYAEATAAFMEKRPPRFEGR